MAADLGALLDPGYLGDLTARDMDEVRAMRAECQEVETGLSLLRRLVQGRLDIVGLELQRRAEGGDPDDLPDLIARLPEVLSDRTHAPGVGRLPQIMTPGEMPAELEAELDGIVGAGHLADLPSVDDASLQAMADQLTDFEHASRAPPRPLRAHRRPAGRDHPPVQDRRGLGRLAAAVADPSFAFD